MSQQVWGKSVKERCEFFYGEPNDRCLQVFFVHMQLTRHTRTVCTHQVRKCDFKDLGCQYKVCIIPRYMFRIVADCPQLNCYIKINALPLTKNPYLRF